MRRPLEDRKTLLFREVPAYLGNVQACMTLLEGQMTMGLNKGLNNWFQDFISAMLPIQVALNERPARTITRRSLMICHICGVLKSGPLIDQTRRSVCVLVMASGHHFAVLVAAGRTNHPIRKYMKNLSK